MQIVRKIKNFSIDDKKSYFLYSDASLRWSKNILGLGGIFKDENKRNIMFYAEQITTAQLPSLWKRRDFESIAMLQSMKIAKEQGIKRLAVHSDSAFLIEAIKTYLRKAKDVKKEDFPAHHLVDFEICLLSKEFEEISFNHVKRENNYEADDFTRYIDDFQSGLVNPLATTAENITTKIKFPEVKNLKRPTVKNNLTKRQKREKEEAELKKAQQKAAIVEEKFVPSINFMKGTNDIVYPESYLNDEYTIQIYDRDVQGFFEVTISQVKDGVVNDDFKKIRALYVPANKAEIFYYLIANLVSEDKFENLIVPKLNKKDSVQLLNYDKTLWDLLSFKGFENNPVHKKRILIANKMTNWLESPKDFLKVTNFNTVKKIVEILYSKENCYHVQLGNYASTTMKAVSVVKLPSKYLAYA